MSDSAITPAATPTRSGMTPKMFAAIVRPLIIDLLATLAFAGLYAATRNIYISTGAGIAMGVGAIAWRIFRRQPIAALQWAGLALVLVMGSAAILTRDPRIIMIKPTIIYAVIGAAMLQPGWMLRYTPPVPAEIIPPSVFVVCGHVWAALMLVSGALNLYFALATDPKVWALFVAVFPVASKCGLFALQFIAISMIARRNKRRLVARAANATPVALAA